MYLKLRVGKLMREKTISEKELAEAAGVARNTVRSLARNANTRVDFEVLEKIAAVLGVRPMELFEETEIPRGPAGPVPQAV